MGKIPDNFNGYLTVGDDVFAFNVADFIVSLLPAQYNERYEVFERIQSHNTDVPEYLLGEHAGKRIAIFCSDKFITGFLGLDLSVRFASPLIIEAAGNADGFFNMLTEEWTMFHAITFYGGNINSICSPQIALEQSNIKECLDNNGAREIKIRPRDDYTHSVEFKVDEEKITLTVSVLQSGGVINASQFGTYSLGELNSYIRFSFDNPQDFRTIKRYYKIVKSLIAILTKQNNVFFNAYLSQKNSQYCLFKTAECKIFDRYPNYSLRKDHNVIPLIGIIEYVPNLIEKIANSEAEVLLPLLPADNKMVHKITITNIQDLCTALEVAYNWGNRNREKDSYIQKLKKRIKKTIKEFIAEYPQIDVSKQTTISSAFDYLDYTLKDKILTLYSENNKVIDDIILKLFLPPINEENITAFVKLRNVKTHSGTFEWGDSANLYPALFALVYVCFFQYIGLSETESESMLLRLF